MSVRRVLGSRLGQSPHRATGTTWWRVSLLVLLTLLVSGCGGGLRHESWPGLSEHDGTLYVANLERIQALNAESGKVYWSYPSEDDKDLRPFYSTPQLAADVGENGLLVIAGFKDQTVYGLALGASAAERPDEVWRFAEASGQYVGTGTISGDVFVIGNGDGNVYALDLADGSKAWQFETNDRVWAKPLVDGDVVYVASLDHHLYALDIETGDELWRFEAAGAIAASPVLVDGDLWIGDFASTLYQIDVETQDAVWTYEAGDWLWATPLETDGILYFADVGGSVYALDVATREFVWDAPTAVGDVVHGRPALNPDQGLLYVPGFEEGGMHAIDAATGDLRSSWGTVQKNPGRLPGDLITDGERLYAMPIMVAARVQAYDLVSGELLWSSPEAE